MCAPNPPSPPNYTQAAQVQGEANLQSTLASNILNNPTQVTPLGSKSQKQTGSFTIPGTAGNPEYTIPTFTSQIDLSPLGQQTLEQQQRISSGLSSLGASQIGKVSDTLSKPFEFGSVGDVQNAAQKAITSRLDPIWAQRDKQVDTQLTNQGLRPGMEAYDNAMRDYSFGKNDAYQQAILGGIQTAPQTLQEAQAVRELPLNELTALASGGQVSMPQFGGMGNNMFSPGNYAGAAGQQGQAANQMYGYEAGNYNSMMNGLYGLGSNAALMFLA